MGISDMNERWAIRNAPKESVFFDPNLSEDEEIALLESKVAKKEFTRRELRGLYLRSKWWRRIRAVVMERDGWECVVCKSIYELHVHHVRYPPFGQEQLSDLVTMCRPCHQKTTVYCNLGKSKVVLSLEGQVYKQLRR
jgi:hypothetical protein